MDSLTVIKNNSIPITKAPITDIGSAPKRGTATHFQNSNTPRVLRVTNTSPPRHPTIFLLSSILYSPFKDRNMFVPKDIKVLVLDYIIKRDKILWGAG